MKLSATELPNWLESLLDRPAAIFGSGVSGLAARDLIVSLGGSAVVFDQRRGESANRVFDAKRAAEFGWCVYSPGFDPLHSWLTEARSAGLELMPETDLGAACWKGPIVAITGTNGKTTLAEFLQSAFVGVGIEAFSCGNIGRPLSRLLAEGANAEAVAVMEVSSFQAEESKRLHADYVVWTNFDEDHLERHGSMERYFRCKYRLVQSMRGKDFLYDPSVARFARQYGLTLDPDGLVEEDDPSSLESAADGTVFQQRPERHNFNLARALWKRMGLDESGLRAAALAFRKSPHRLECVGASGDVTFWDDSKATNFHAVFGALERFERPVIWIGGGKDKGGDIAAFARRLAPHLRSAHLIGQTKEELGRRLKEHGVETHVYPSIEAAVAGARASASLSGDILLSPGFASLDMFESYSQRGMAFREAIKNLE